MDWGPMIFHLGDSPYRPCLMTQMVPPPVPPLRSRDSCWMWKWISKSYFRGNKNTVKKIHI